MECFYKQIQSFYFNQPPNIQHNIVISLYSKLLFVTSDYCWKFLSITQQTYRILYVGTNANF